MHATKIASNENTSEHFTRAYLIEIDPLQELIHEMIFKCAHPGTKRFHRAIREKQGSARGPFRSDAQVQRIKELRAGDKTQGLYFCS